MKKNETEVLTRFNQFLDFFEKEISLLDSIFQLFLYLNDSLESKKHEMMESPFFFNAVFVAFENYLFTTICKLYEGNSSKINLNRFLNFLEQNSIELFDLDVSDTVTRDREKIKSYEDILGNFKGWRDKKLSHYDNDVLKPDIFSTKYKVTKKNFIDLIQLAEDIVNNYAELTENGKLIFICTNYDDIENIFYILQKKSIKG